MTLKSIPTLFLFAIISTNAVNAATTAKAPAWNQSMKELAQTLRTLLVDLNSDERFNSQKNFKTIQANANRFAKIAQGVAHTASPDSDPSIAIIASLFAQEANHAAAHLALGHRAYAREALRSMTGYCMACHTRNNKGPDFNGLDLPADTLAKSLRAVEAADFYASIRQFDRALTEYRKIISDASVSEHQPLDWARAVKSALAISVRVKKDPSLALDLVEKILATPRAPYYLKEQAASWKISLQQWKAETPVTPQTEEGYYAQSIKLIAAAKSAQKYPADRAADMLYLRASGAVHDLLGFKPRGQHFTEALFLAGLSYEVLRDLNLWDMHEFYYLACIQEGPHTEQARQCFKHYEENIYASFTGSGGTFLPDDIKLKLKKLDELSAPKLQ